MLLSVTLLPMINLGMMISSMGMGSDTFENPWKLLQYIKSICSLVLIQEAYFFV